MSLGGAVFNHYVYMVKDMKKGQIGMSYITCHLSHVTNANNHSHKPSPC